MQDESDPFGAGLSYCVPSLGKPSLGPDGRPSLSRGAGGGSRGRGESERLRGALRQAPWQPPALYAHPSPPASCATVARPLSRRARVTRGNDRANPPAAVTDRLVMRIKHPGALRRRSDHHGCGAQVVKGYDEPDKLPGLGRPHTDRSRRPKPPPRNAAGLEAEIFEVPPLTDAELDGVAAGVPALAQPLGNAPLRAFSPDPLSRGVASRLRWGEASLPATLREFRRKVWRELIRDDGHEAGQPSLLSPGPGRCRHGPRPGRDQSPRDAEGLGHRVAR